MTLETPKMDDLNDKNHQDEIQSCNHFLVDFEIDNAGLKVFDFAIDTLSDKIVKEKTRPGFQKIELRSQS